MSYLRKIGVLLAVPAFCLIIGTISTDAQVRAHARRAMGHRARLAPASEKVRPQEIQRIETSSRPANLSDDRTVLKNPFAYRRDLIDAGSGYTPTKAFPYPQTTSRDAEYPAQQRRHRTSERRPQYDNYTGDLVIPARSGIGFKIRIGSGQTYP